MPVQSISESLLQTVGIKLVNSTDLYPGLHQSGDAGLPMLVVENEQAKAVIALQGAHLMAFKPAGQPEMLWISPQCVLDAGKPIRGGIPLCLPWFGPGPDGKTMHGFGRVLEWTLATAEIQENGATRLVLELNGDSTTNELWPHAFAFSLEVVVGSKLEMALTAQNRGAETAPFTFAYHTYFAVPDVAAARVGGLDGVSYIDKLDNFSKKQQQGDVAITSMTDCVYLDSPALQTVKSAYGTARIEADTHCTVVWNAWTNDKNIPDMGEGNHVGYICVEPCDTADFAQILPPGQIYRARMTLSW